MYSAGVDCTSLAFVLREKVTKKLYFALKSPISRFLDTWWSAGVKCIPTVKRSALSGNKTENIVRSSFEILFVVFSRFTSADDCEIVDQKQDGDGNTMYYIHYTDCEPFLCAAPVSLFPACRALCSGSAS